MKFEIIGHFAKGKNLNDGQTVKTRNLYHQLVEMYGEKEVGVVDTHQYKKHPFSLLFQCILAIKEKENIIILPAKNGIKVFVPLFVYLNKLFHKKLFYVVVGGWLPEFLADRPKLQQQVQKITMIFVETENMKKKLNRLGMKNVDILPNFKKIKIVDKKDLVWNPNLPIKVCTFSRVMKEKGIENAIHAITSINQKENRKIFHLDIYGPIVKKYQKEFDTITKKYHHSVSYQGVVDAKNSVSVLKDYQFLLFPTYYEGEGFAGTIIDAFSSGVPVIASDWKYNSEIIKNEYNGFLFPTKDDEQLVKVLYEIYQKKYDIPKIKENCLKCAEKYISEKAIKKFLKYVK